MDASSTPPPTPAPHEMVLLPKSWAAELQRRLLVMYGYRLGAALTDADACEEWIQTWRETLAGVTGAQIACGLAELQRRIKRAAREGRTEWPMSSVEFRALCEGQVWPAHRPIPALPPPARSEAGAQAIARMRAIVAGEAPTTAP